MFYSHSSVQIDLTYVYAPHFAICIWIFIEMELEDLKGRVSQTNLILSLVLLGIIYGGEIVETARSDLKMFQNCKISSFLGLLIRRFGFRRGWGR